MGVAGEPTPKMHHRCKHCNAVVKTNAQKSFKCPQCGKRTRIHHARAVKPPRSEAYMKTSLDQHREPGRR